ncbi:MAG: hypothetical protein FJY43_09925 [Betaproteobacteria bacterium]|nr:hypothetical protein [Betaproteobacteria bacterium]
MAPSRFLCLQAASALLVVASVVGFGEWAWRNLDLQARISPMRYQAAVVERAGARVTLLALGDSHAGLGYLPKLEGAMNAAFPGETIGEMRLKAELLVPRIAPDAVVLLQAQPQMFFAHRKRPASRPYKALRGADSHPLAGLLPQFDPCCRAQVLPEALAALGGRGFPAAHPEVGATGFIRYSHLLAYPHEKFPELARREVASYGSEAPLPELITEYESLVRALAGTGRRVVLAQYPLSQSLWEAAGPGMLNALQARIRAIAAGHGLEVCGDWSPYPDELHLNPDHLNQDGARCHAELLERCAAPRKGH